MRYSDIVIDRDPDGRELYWVDLAAREPGGDLDPYLGSWASGRLLHPAGYPRNFAKGSTVLDEIDRALWDEWGSRMDRGQPVEATFRIVYYPTDATKRIISDVHVSEYGVGDRLTSYGQRFKRAKAVYPA